jgi:hypothetical protein
MGAIRAPDLFAKANQTRRINCISNTLIGKRSINVLVVQMCPFMLRIDM